MSMLHYELHPGKQEAAPLYLVHTIPLDMDYFRKSLRGVNIEGPIVLLDLPNHGKSPDLEKDEISFARFAEEIDKLRKHLGHEKIRILGHGVGGFVAQHYACNYQKFLEALIILNSAPDARYRQQMAWNIRDRYSKIVIQSIMDYQGKTDDKSLRARFTQSFAVHFKPTNHEAAKLLLDGAERVAIDAYIVLAEKHIPNHNMRKPLRKVKVPTLIIGSTNDVWPEENVKQIKGDMEHATLFFMKAGHFPMIEGAPKFWDTIFTWIEQNTE